MTNSVDPDQTAPIGAVCSGTTLFASILNLSLMFGNYLQPTTSADGIFRLHFFSWRFKVQLHSCIIIMCYRKTCLKRPLKNNKDHMTNVSLTKVESIADCCNNLDLH